MLWPYILAGGAPVRLRVEGLVAHAVVGSPNNILSVNKHLTHVVVGSQPAALSVNKALVHIVVEE